MKTIKQSHFHLRKCMPEKNFDTVSINIFTQYETIL